ncbi:MAG: helix-turn-helix domain-containing protein [Nitriliruptoraceae bacterium]
MTATLLTAQQVQDLLDVDASTVYRMASDGRLPAVRIGRQWRFPAEEINALLVPGNGQPARTTTTTPFQRTTLSALPDAIQLDDQPADDGPVPIDLAIAVLEAMAPTLGVTMVVTALDGRPLTPLVNPAPLIAEKSQDPGFTASCSEEWRGFADEPQLDVRLRPSWFGFLCAHSLVRHGPSLIAMVLAGGIAPDGTDDPDLFHLDADERRRVIEALPRTAALLSRLARTPQLSAAPAEPLTPTAGGS